MEHKLFSLWKVLDDNAGQWSAKDQKNALAVFNSWYKKANYQVQGEFHHLVHHYVSPDCNCAECAKDKKCM